MTPLLKILAGVVPGVALVSVSILFFWWCRRRRPQPQQQQQLISSANKDLAAPSPAIDKFHNKSNGGKNSLRFHQLNQKPNIQQQQQHQDVPPPFNWDAHPRLTSDAVDHGWSQFVFLDHRSSVPRSSPPLWTLCASCDSVWSQESPPQIICDVQSNTNTSEFMQTVRISPTSTSTSTSTPFVIEMSLPLPGPSLIGSSFPQEAYFEISIAQLQPAPNWPPDSRKRSQDGSASDGDDDRSKLIDQNPCKVHSDGRIETNSPSTEGVAPGKPLICLGLTTGGSAETKLVPGTYPGSIGFHSNGSLFLDGMNLVPESSKAEWATADKVIGCGFNPSRKKVYFTVDSELVHVVRCNSDAYRSPLYPILAANSDATIVVNLGQAPFEYAPANAHRTANPCFGLQPSPSYSYHSVGAYEDSREFFSVGMPEAECSECAGNGKGGSKGSTKSSKRIKYNWDEDGVSMDVDKDSDLFEIALNY